MTFFLPEKAFRRASFWRTAFSFIAASYRLQDLGVVLKNISRRTFFLRTHRHIRPLLWRGAAPHFFFATRITFHRKQQHQFNHVFSQNVSYTISYQTNRRIEMAKSRAGSKGSPIQPGSKRTRLEHDSILAIEDRCLPNFGPRCLTSDSAYLNIQALNAV